MVCWNCLKWKPTAYLPHEKHFMGVFSLRGMSVVGKKGHHQVQTHFPHGRVPSHQSICFTFGCAGRSPGFPAGSWITSMFTIEVIFFQLFFFNRPSQNLRSNLLEMPWVPRWMSKWLPGPKVLWPKGQALFWSSDPGTQARALISPGNYRI